MRYSKYIAGNKGNYDWKVRFDRSQHGYLGISQDHSPGSHGIERVLLCPRQVNELLKFLGAERKRREDEL